MRLCKAGLNEARLNFSHNTHADHQRRIDLVKEVRNELQLPTIIQLYWTINMTARKLYKRISKNVYAKTLEECEEKLAELIKIMKAEIAEMKKAANA